MSGRGSVAAQNHQTFGDGTTVRTVVVEITA